MRLIYLGLINLLVNLGITLITDISATLFKNRLLKYTFTPTPTLNMPSKPISNAKMQAIPLRTSHFTRASLQTSRPTIAEPGYATTLTRTRSIGILLNQPPSTILLNGR